MTQRRLTTPPHGAAPYQGEPFATIKAAEAAGFVKALAQHYGGEWALVKGRVMLRDPRQAGLRTWWRYMGCRVREREEPHAVLVNPWYRADQVELRTCQCRPPEDCVRRIVLLPDAVLRWNDGTVPRVAEGILRDRAFGRMPVLADALLDAGCDDEIILSHCRQPGPHLPGCWVLRLLLRR